MCIYLFIRTWPSANSNLPVHFESDLVELDAKRVDALSEPRAEFKSLSQALELLISGDRFVPQCDM